MIVYYNNDKLLNFHVYDVEFDNNIHEKFLFSPTGIYKKYKHHYFQMDDSDILYEKYTYKGNQEIYVQNELPKLNKKCILTSMNLDSYEVNRVKHTLVVHDNITLVKEIDNTTNVHVYFVVENMELMDAIESIENYCNKL